MNNSGPRYKRSKVERDLNLDVIACVVILFVLCFLGGVGKCFFLIIYCQFSVISIKLLNDFLLVQNDRVKML